MNVFERDDVSKKYLNDFYTLLIVQFSPFLLPLVRTCVRIHTPIPYYYIIISRVVVRPSWQSYRLLYIYIYTYIYIFAPTYTYTRAEQCGLRKQSCVSQCILHVRFSFLLSFFLSFFFFFLFFFLCIFLSPLFIKFSVNSFYYSCPLSFVLSFFLVLSVLISLSLSFSFAACQPSHFAFPYYEYDEEKKKKKRERESMMQVILIARVFFDIHRRERTRRKGKEKKHVCQRTLSFVRFFFHYTFVRFIITIPFLYSPLFTLSEEHYLSLDQRLSRCVLVPLLTMIIIANSDLFFI